MIDQAAFFFVLFWWICCAGFTHATVAPPRVSPRQALNAAENGPKSPHTDMFSDVYAELPHHLREQKQEMEAFVEKHGHPGGH